MSLPSYNQALDSALSIAQKISEVEKVLLELSFGRFLAKDIVADRDLPPYNRSQMDGYAVVASEVKKGGTMKVSGNVPAGTNFDSTVESNTCITIATGAPVPDCFDTVVQHELTDNGSLQVTFHCSDIKKGKSIHPRGSDAKVGDVLIAKHTTLAPQHIGIAASVGVHEVEVLSKPRVVVISSGDEVVPIDTQPLPYQIRNGNS